MALPPHLLPGLCAVDKAERILHELLFDVAALHAQRAAATLRELIAACDEAHRSHLIPESRVLVPSRPPGSLLWGRSVRKCEHLVNPAPEETATCDEDLDYAHDELLRTVRGAARAFAALTSLPTPTADPSSSSSSSSHPRPGDHGGLGSGGGHLDGRDPDPRRDLLLGRTSFEALRAAAAAGATPARVSTTSQ